MKRHSAACRCPSCEKERHEYRMTRIRGEQEAKNRLADLDAAIANTPEERNQ